MFRRRDLLGAQSDYNNSNQNSNISKSEIIKPQSGIIDTSKTQFFKNNIIINPSITTAGRAPDQISTQPTLWFTARDPSYVLSGGSPASEGASVDTWNSYKGTYSYTQSTAGLKPLYKSNQWGNNLPSVLADGVDDTLSGDANIKGLTNNISSYVAIFLGGWVAFGAANTFLASHSIGANTNARALVGAGSTGGRLEVDRGLDADTSTTITSGATYAAGLEVSVYIIDFTNKRGRLLRNNVQILANTTFTNQTAGNTSATNSNVAALFSNNGGSCTNYALTDYVAYVNYIPTDAELFDIGSYFSSIAGGLGF